MTIILPTKKQVTKKFIIGVAMIGISLILGKLIFILLIFIPNNSIKIIMLGTYFFSWLLFFAGLILAGIEGYYLVTKKYKIIQHRAIENVKRGGKRAANNIVVSGRHSARQTVRFTKSATKYTQEGTRIVTKHTGRAMKRGLSKSIQITKDVARKIKK